MKIHPAHFLNTPLNVLDSLLVKLTNTLAEVKVYFNYFNFIRIFP